MKPTAPDGSKVKIIDAHCHFCPPCYMNHLDRAGGVKSPWQVHDDSKPMIRDIRDRLAFMDERNVDVGVLVPAPWIESAREIVEDPAGEIDAARRPQPRRRQGGLRSWLRT